MPVPLARPALALLFSIAPALGCAEPAPPGVDELFAELAEGVSLPSEWPRIRAFHSTWRTLVAQEVELRERVQRNPGPEVWAELGGVYTMAEELDLALPSLVEALRAPAGSTQGSKAAWAWAWLGLRQFKLGDLTGARAFSARALELGSDAGPAHFTQARLARLAGDEEAALTALVATNRVDPGRVDAALELSSLLEAREEFEEAARVLGRTLKTDRNHPGVLWRLAGVRRALGSELEAQALEKLHARAIRMDDLGVRGQNIDRVDLALILGLSLIHI